MPLQFILDGSGNTTAVIVPILEWNAIMQTRTDKGKGDNGIRKGKKLKPSDFKGIFSADDAGRFHKHLTKVRKEWDRDLS